MKSLMEKESLIIKCWTHWQGPDRATCWGWTRTDVMYTMGPGPLGRLSLCHGSLPMGFTKQVGVRACPACSHSAVLDSQKASEHRRSTPGLCPGQSAGFSSLLPTWCCSGENNPSPEQPTRIKDKQGPWYPEARFRSRLHQQREPYDIGWDAPPPELHLWPKALDSVPRSYLEHWFHRSSGIFFP